MKPSPLSEKHAPIVLAFTYFFGSTDFIATKLALGALPPFFLSGMRWGVSGLLVCGVLFSLGFAPPNLRQIRNALAVSLLLIVGGNGLRTLGQAHVDVGLAAVVMSMGPLFLTLLSPLLCGDPKPAGRVYCLLLSSIVGLAIAILPATSIEMDSGVWFVLPACLLWTIGSLFSRRPSSHPNRIMAAGLQMVMASPILLACSAVSGEWTHFHMASISLVHCLAAVYLIATLTGYLGYIWLLSHTAPAVAASCAYMNPIIALLLSSVLLGEKPGPATLLGCGLVLISTMLLFLLNRRTASSLTPL